MDVFPDISALRSRLADFRQRHSIALVPTMGALHEGHRACIDVARSTGGTRVVASIFVNPTQFGAGEDLGAYPRSLDEDVDRCREWGCDAVFTPGADTMYPEKQVTWVTVGGITEPLCGTTRPGHFRGVATVVAKLFHVVEPDFAVFGQKDAQQALVIRKMVMQLAMPVELRLARTVRESDGLALSSRNAYLGPAERVRAQGIYQALLEVGRSLDSGERSARALEAAAIGRLQDGGIDDVEYVELRRSDDLSAMDAAEGRVILAVAVRVGTTRLIDNMVFDVTQSKVTKDVTLF